MTGPLLMSYGGGHANIIAPLAKKLAEAGHKPTVLGLTTAYQVFLRQGLKAQNVSSLIDGRRADYAYAAEIAQSILPQQRHVDVSAQETWDYFTIGMHDMIVQYGESQARALVAKEGRFAFNPMATMQAYLKELNPCVIVVTTSPRFELALMRAGKRLGIPTVAIADIYVQRERELVLSGDYADHLCVLNTVVKDGLIADGIDKNTKVHATGNPAFDSLTSLTHAQDRRSVLRAQLGVQDKTLILWPSASVRQAEFTDKPFASPAEVSAAFEGLCQRRPDYAYMLRPHPNTPHTLPDTAHHGILDPGFRPDDALLVADVVCFEVSTMGLQGHLAGLPTICVGFPDIAVFPKYNKGLIADDLSHAVAELAARDLKTLQQDAAEQGTLENATSTITQLIVAISHGAGK